MPCRLPSCVPEVPQEPCSEPGLRAGATTTIHHRCTGTSGVPQEPSTRAIAQGSVWTNLVTQAKREPVFPRQSPPSMIIVDSCVLHSCRRRMEHLRPSNASKQQLTRRVRTVGHPPHEGRGEEFASVDFNDYCTELGVRRDLTTPYNPQENGVMARSMLKAKALPGMF